MNEWREDLRKVMMKAGLENNPTVFLFSDTQVIPYFAFIRWSCFFSFQNNLDPYYKTGLDLWDSLGRVNLV